MKLSPSQGKHSPFEYVFRGASLHVVGQVGRSLLTFLLNVVLTRGLGVGLYGIFSYSYIIIRLISIVALMGTGESILRFLPANSGDQKKKNFYVVLAYLTVSSGSIFLGFVIFIFAPEISTYTLQSTHFVDTLRVFSILVPLLAILKLTNSVFRAEGKMEYQVIVSDIFLPITQMITISIALFAGYSILGLTAAFVIGTFLVALIGVRILTSKTEVRFSIPSKDSGMNIANFYKFSIPLTFKDIGSILYTRIDILMVGYFLAEVAVGLYQVSILVAGFLSLSLAAFNQLFPPVASSLFEAGRNKELASLYKTVTRWTITITIPPTLFVGLYSHEILLIFGPEFADGALILTLLAIAQLTNAAVGPSGYLLMMSGHQLVVMINQWLLGGLNILLNYLLIMEYGLIGAALATTIVLILINIVRVFEVKFTEGLLPFSKSYIKPVFSGAVASLPMIVLSELFSGIILLLIGGSIGIIVFSISLILLGIDDHDINFLNQVVKGHYR